MFSHQLPRRPGEEGAIEGVEKSLRNGGQGDDDGDDDGECDDDDDGDGDGDGDGECYNHHVCRHCDC